MPYHISAVVDAVDPRFAPTPAELRVLRLTTAPDFPAEALQEVLTAHFGFTSQILRIVNSNAFNVKETIDSTDEALRLLGLTLVRDIALSIVVFRFFSRVPRHDRLRRRTLWRHSVHTALVGRALAARYDPGNGDLYYAAGLLHDLGKLVVRVALGDDFYFLIEKSRHEQRRLDDVERQYLGFHHGEVGALLIERWGLPETLTRLIRFHHHPEEAGTEHVGECRYMHLSNLMSHYLEQEMNGLPELLEFEPRFEEIFEFTEDEFNTLARRVKSYVAASGQYFEIHQT